MIVVGVDEAGRGPLAGPVAVGVVMARTILDSDKSLGVLRDSKKLTRAARERWFAWLKDLRRRKKLNFVVSLVGAKVIDKQGITKAVALGISRSLRRLKLSPKTSKILLDGLLRAPKKFSNQKTIIGGDDSEPLIALASIAAKVTRDRKMVRLARLYPNYKFEIHKGYGTKLHYRCLKKFGCSPLHRQSFLKKNYL